MSTEERVKEVIAEQLSVDLAKVVPSANLVDELKADSLDLMEMVIEMEDTFRIQITDDQAEKIETVQDVVDLVGELSA